MLSKYLNLLRNVNTICDTDEGLRTLQALQLFILSLGNDSPDATWKYLLLEDCQQVFAKLYQAFAEQLIMRRYDYVASSMAAFWQKVSSLTWTVSTLADYSDAMKAHLTTRQMLSKLCLFLEMKNAPRDVSSLLLRLLYTLSTAALTDKFVWLDSQLFDTFSELLERQTLPGDLHTCICVTLGNVSFDRQLEKLDLAKSVAHLSGEMYKNVEVILESLCKFAVCDKAKPVVFEHVWKKLREILLKDDGNDEIKSLVGDLLGQLCFNKTIAKELTEDKVLLSLLVNKFPDLHFFIYWQRNSLLKQEKVSLAKKDYEQVLLSCDSKSQGEEIKKRLEASGFKVASSPSSLRTACELLSDSACLIIAVDEAYRQSWRCRALAEQVCATQKPLVPLITQQGYEKVSDGWLGRLLEGKVCILDGESEKLVAEIARFCPKKTIREEPTLIPENFEQLKIAAKKKEESAGVELWAEQQVELWFFERGISLKLLHALKPCTGVVLCELYRLRTQDMRLFYKIMEKCLPEKNSDAMICLFSYHLQKLFDNDGLA